MGQLNHTIVVGVAADPEPDDPASLHSARRAVAKANPHGVDMVLALQLFEAETPMRGVTTEQSVRLLVESFSTQSKQVVQRTRLAPLIGLKRLLGQLSNPAAVGREAPVPGFLVG
jgi:hypothetical protein